jgi:hypothetical protein
MVINCNHFANEMARSKRIAISVEPSLHEKLIRLSEYQKKPVTVIVSDYMKEFEPAIDLTLKAFDDLHNGGDHARILQDMIADGLNMVSKKIKDA